MKPNVTEQEIAKSERRGYVLTLLGLVLGKGLTVCGRRKGWRPLRVCGRIVTGFSLLSAATLAFIAYVARQDMKDREKQLARDRVM